MILDLRSDTVTKPSAGMRWAMADAEVGVRERALEALRARVFTNIVMIDLAERSAHELVARLRTLDLLVNAVAPYRLRAVVHRDLEAAHIAAALGAFSRA